MPKIFQSVLEIFILTSILSGNSIIAYSTTFISNNEISSDYLVQLNKALDAIKYQSGDVHMSIGIPNTVDQLKSFLDNAGGISPGVYSYGIAFGLFDGTSFYTPSDDTTRGLSNGMLLPWISFEAGASAQVQVDFAQAELSEGGQVLAINATVTSMQSTPTIFTFVIVITDIGPCGGSIETVGNGGNALFINGHTSVVSLNGNFGNVTNRKEVQVTVEMSFELLAMSSTSLGFIVPIQPGTWT